MPKYTILNLKYFRKKKETLLFNAFSQQWKHSDKSEVTIILFLKLVLFEYIYTLDQRHATSLFFSLKLATLSFILAYFVKYY